MHLLASLLTIAFAGPAIEGNPQSPVRVLIYEDLQGAECAKLRAMLDGHLLARYGGQVAFEHRDFPSAGSTWSRRAAMAARFFDGQNPKLGVEFRRHLLANFEKITADELPSWIAAFARQYAVDAVKAVHSLHHSGLAAAVDQDVKEGRTRGVANSPAVFVDGVAATIASLSTVLETALAPKKPE